MNDGKPITEWGPEYEIHLDINFNSNYCFPESSIFHFTTDRPVGERIPWLACGTPRTGGLPYLWLGTQIDKRNKGFEQELGQFYMGTWYTFIISQKKDSVSIFLGKLLKQA